MKASKKNGRRSKQPATLKTKPLKARDPEHVRGGKTAPPPGGPVPIPYPNVAKS